MSENSCDCPRPPGGRVVCAADQIAICRIKNGEPQMACISPPARLLQPISPRQVADLRSWVSNAITGEKPKLLRSLTSLELPTLASGEYINPRTGELVTFTLPVEVRAALGIEGIATLTL